MSSLAAELDEKLRTLDAKAASSLEKLVRDAMDLVDTSNGINRAKCLPPDFFTRIAEAFGPEPFERPPQGGFEEREAW